MYQHIGGIRPLAPGYKKILIAPQPGGTLTHAATRFDSAYGAISSHWVISNGQLTLNAEIPANTTAEIVFPAAEGVTLNGADLATSASAALVQIKDGKTHLSVGSGNYELSGRW